MISLNIKVIKDGSSLRIDSCLDFKKNAILIEFENRSPLITKSLKVEWVK